MVCSVVVTGRSFVPGGSIIINAHSGYSEDTVSITELLEDSNELTCYFHGFCFVHVDCMVESCRENKKTKLLSYTAQYG